MKASEIIKSLDAKEYDARLQDIYIDNINYQNQRYSKALQSFITLYGDQEVSIFSAPGRSEISGNHTDHQHGRVLAAAINLDIIGIVTKAKDIKVVSDTYDIASIDVSNVTMKEEEVGTSEALIRGVVSRYQQLGYTTGGFKGYFTSDVLVGSGLSSSAAFEVLIGTILSGLYNSMKIDPVVIGQVGQYAENVYFKKPCGLMDQCASAVGGFIYIDFKNPTKPIVEKLDVDFSHFNHSLCIIDTLGSHINLTPDYAAIPTEMKQVAKVFNKEVLGDVNEDDFYNHIAMVRKQCQDRAILRAIHFFEENERVLVAREALKHNDFETFKKIIIDSGDSSFKYLQNVYTNNDIEHQSVSIALAMSEVLLQGDGALRVHGGGFAGTILAFVPNEYVEVYKHEIENVIGKDVCRILKIRSYGSMQVL
jgi:galactokinase